MDDPHDPYGLRSLDLDRLRSKDGAKWQAQRAPFAAWVADMDFDVAPAVVEAMRIVLDGNAFGYPNWGGPYAKSPAVELFPVRQAERYGWEPALSRCHELADVIQGVRATVHHLSKAGDGIVLHLPAYHPFLHTIEEMDRRLVPVGWTGDAFDYDALEDELSATPAKIWILCHPHNPLGRAFDRSELERIAEVAARHDLIVISDEIHADLTMPGATHIPFEALGPEVAARTVTITSASKAFNLAGLRWAVLHAGHAPMHAALEALPGHYLGAPNVMAVAATEAAWAHGDGWLSAVVDVLDDNRRALQPLFDEHLPGATARPIDATYLAWIDCRALDLAGDPAAAFRERGVEVSPGPQFSPLGHGDGHVRLNLATSPAILDATIRAMAG